MITPKLCSRIYFYADRQRSRRYKRIDLLDALNIAAEAVKMGRYDNIKKNVGYSFETLQRVRDELYTILKNQTTIVPSGPNIIQPTDYDIEVLMYMTIDSKQVLSRSRTYEESDLSTNVYANPSDDYPIHRKTSTGWTFEYGSGSFSNANLWYLIPQDEIFWDDSANTLVNGSTPVNGVKYFVEVGPARYNGTTYTTGQTFVGVTGGGVMSLMIAGSLVESYVDCNLPRILHEEVAKIAASILMGTFENYNKSMRIEQEVNRS